MGYDYSKLRGRICEKLGSQINFAIKMGLSERSISVKLNAKRDWTQKEIKRACDILDIKYEEIPEYFFKIKVQY